MARRKENVLLGRPRATISKRNVLGRNRPGTNGDYDWGAVSYEANDG